MLDFIQEHHQILSVAISTVMMLIWLLYLNLIYIGMRRSQRPMILISRGAGTGPEARLFVSNMGAEPIYVTALIADCQTPKGVETAYITQNDHIGSDELSSPDRATNEGPLESGHRLDAGSFENLMTRIQMHSANHIDLEQIQRLTLTVVASTGYSAQVSAARKAYRVVRKDKVIFHPEKISTRQLTGFFARRRLCRRLESELDSEY